MPAILVQYYFDYVCKAWSCFDSPLNPFRLIVSRLWSRNAAIYYAIQSMAAASLANDLPAMRIIGRQTQQQAIACLRNNPRIGTLHRDNQDDEFFLALLMIGLTTAWHDAADLGLEYLKEAKDHLNKQQQMCQSPDSLLAKQYPLFQQCLLYWNMLAAFVAENSLLLDEGSVLDQPDLETSVYLIDGQTLPHPWTGPLSKALRLFYKTARIVRANRISHRTRADNIDLTSFDFDCLIEEIELRQKAERLEEDILCSLNFICRYSTMPEEIVALDVCQHAMPAFHIPHTLVEYHNTKEAEVAERLRDATIAVTSAVPITAETIAQCPHLKLICVSIVGVDHIDVEACRARSIRVCNTPAATTEAVAEHAIALYFAAKRNIVRAHNWVMSGKEWEQDSTGMSAYERLPTPINQDTLGLVGYGKIGQKVEVFARALGMKVLIADRRGIPDASIRHGRTAFDAVLRQSTILVLTCPLDQSTANMISKKELQSMQSSCILINVGRGGLVKEEAIIAALKARTIAGYATDVFAVEPATKGNSSLLSSDIPNLTLSPHLAWYSSESIERQQASIQAIVEGFANGNYVNVIC
ncbi:Glycerate dehydrogenase [Penicillium rolfsii]|nr:Glycerate dehydrogenase [Penicillium rolfsii]